MTKLANGYIKDKKLIEIDIETFEYSHRDNTTSRVIVSKRTCTCSKYNDRAICAHLVAACIISNTKVVGIKPKGVTLRTRRRKLNKKRSLSADGVNLLQPEPDLLIRTNDYEALALERAITPKKRGRPPKATKALIRELEPIQIVTQQQNLIDRVTPEIAQKVNQQILERRTSKRLNAKASSDSVIIEKTVKKHKK